MPAAIRCADMERLMNAAGGHPDPYDGARILNLDPENCKYIGFPCTSISVILPAFLMTCPSDSNT